MFNNKFLFFITLGWTGTDCSLPCPTGYYGQQCKMKCVCQNGAKCGSVSGNCYCTDGFEGLL